MTKNRAIKIKACLKFDKRLTLTKGNNGKQRVGMQSVTLGTKQESDK